MALNGSLDDYSPAGALRVLASTGRTGAVRFAGPAGCSVYLADGLLYFARGPETDEALATALVRPGRVSPEAWTRAVDEAGDTPRVGELLVAHGAIDADLLASVVLSVIYDPLITLFRGGDDRFEFEPDTMHWIGPYRGFDVEAVVNEVRRRVRATDEMSDVVPSIDAWVTAATTLPDTAGQVTLQREDWELVAALAGPRTIGELAAALGRGRYSTAQIVHRLARIGLLGVTPEPFGPPGSTPIHEPSAAERLAEAISDPPPEASPGGPVDAGGNGAVLGPRLAGPAGTGPEAAPGHDPLPRRIAVRDVQPARPAPDATIEDDADEDDADRPLAGIVGFRDPVADLTRENTALADATGEDRDANAAWLESLYAQFIDADEGAEEAIAALDVAFQTSDQAEKEKAGTLRRLIDALRRL